MQQNCVISMFCCWQSSNVPMCHLQPRQQKRPEKWKISFSWERWRDEGGWVTLNWRLVLGLLLLTEYFIKTKIFQILSRRIKSKISFIMIIYWYISACVQLPERLSSAGQSAPSLSQPASRPEHAQPWTTRLSDIVAILTQHLSVLTFGSRKSKLLLISSYKSLESKLFTAL